MNLTHATLDTRVDLLLKRDVTVSALALGFVIFNFGLPRLPTWAVAWSFGWCQEIPLGILSLKGDMQFGCE